MYFLFIVVYSLFLGDFFYACDYGFICFSYNFFFKGIRMYLFSYVYFLLIYALFNVSLSKCLFIYVFTCMCHVFL